LRLNQLAEGLAIVAFVTNKDVPMWKFFNENRRLGAVIDLFAGDLKRGRQPTGIHCQMNLAGLARPTCTDGLILTTCGTGTMLVRFGVAAIDEDPFQVGFNHQRLKDLEPFSAGAPRIEALVDLAPRAEGIGQVAPRTADAHAIQHPFDRHPQISLVIDAVLQQNRGQLRPVLISESQSGHGKFVSVACQNSYDANLPLVFQRLGLKREQTLATVVFGFMAKLLFKEITTKEKGHHDPVRVWHPQGLKTTLEDFIVKGVDVIILSPVDSQGVIAALARAQAAGIKVITVDIPAAQGQVISHIGTDNYTGGVKAGELMAQILHGHGKVAVIDYPTVQSVVNRVNGFKDALKNHPGIEIAAQQTGITRAAALAVATKYVASPSRHYRHFRVW